MGKNMATVQDFHRESHFLETFRKPSCQACAKSHFLLMSGLCPKLEGLLQLPWMSLTRRETEGGKKGVTTNGNNDQIIGNKQGTTRPLSGHSLMRASKGVITTSMMKPVMLMLVMVKLLMLRSRDETAPIVWRDCPSTQPQLTLLHTHTQIH